MLWPFYILATWIVAIAVNSTELFVFRLVEYPEKLVCERHWNEVFGESSSLENYIMSFLVVFNFILLVLIAILYIIICLKLKSQKIPGEQLANANWPVLKMTIDIVLGFPVCWLLRAILFILLFKLVVCVNYNIAFCVIQCMLDKILRPVSTYILLSGIAKT